MKELIEVGKIVASRGLDGTLKVLSGFLPKDFINLNYCLIDSAEYRILKLSGKSGCLFFKIDGIDKIEKAEKLKNKTIFIKRENISLNKGEYLIDDLLNMQVFTDDGNYLGILTEIENFGSKDVYTIKDGKTEKTFCLIENLIKEVDYLSNKIILFSNILSEVLVWKLTF